MCRYLHTYIHIYLFICIHNDCIRKGNQYITKEHNENVNHFGLYADNCLINKGCLSKSLNLSFENFWVWDFILKKTFSTFKASFSSDVMFLRMQLSRTCHRGVATFYRLLVEYEIWVWNFDWNFFADSRDFTKFLRGKKCKWPNHMILACQLTWNY